jgi:hypothetical protein
MTSVADRACFGVYVDREALPDAELLAAAIDGAITELLDGIEGRAGAVAR